MKRKLDKEKGKEQGIFYHSGFLNSRNAYLIDTFSNNCYFDSKAMTFPDLARNHELPFVGTEIYFSGSIRGAENKDQLFSYHLVQFLMKKGANVLSEHVAARDRAEMVRIFNKRTGIDLGSFDRQERAKIARQVDLAWVRQATHLIAIVDNPSLGVGIEIQEAIRKPQLGFNKTPILCLVSDDIYDQDRLSNMVTGIDAEKEGAIFKLGIYYNFESAQRIVIDFLHKNPSLKLKWPPEPRQAQL